MWSYYSQAGIWYITTGVPVRRGHKGGRQPGDDGGRDPSGAAASQGVRRTVCKYQRLEEEGKDPPSEPSREAGLCCHRGLGFWPPELETTDFKATRSVRAALGNYCWVFGKIHWARLEGKPKWTRAGLLGVLRSRSPKKWWRLGWGWWQWGMERRWSWEMLGGDIQWETMEVGQLCFYLQWLTHWTEGLRHFREVSHQRDSWGWAQAVMTPGSGRCGLKADVTELQNQQVCGLRAGEVCGIKSPTQDLDWNRGLGTASHIWERSVIWQSRACGRSKAQTHRLDGVHEYSAPCCQSYHCRQG